MKCGYPFCNKSAFWVPILALPTMRYSSTKDEWVKTDLPTLLESRAPVCQEHKDNFDLTKFFPEQSWKKIQDIAKSRGFHIPDREIFQVQFRQIGWKPSHRFMELERGVKD